MWTFTLPVKMAPKVAACMWRELSRELVRNLKMWGIRVFEPHPGGHGLHVHAVVSGFYDVNAVRKIASAHGWGRINVVPVHDPEYVAKYLSKSRRPPDWRGIRLWSAFGKKITEWVPSKVKDIESHCAQSDAYRKIASFLNPIGRTQQLKTMAMARDYAIGALHIAVTENESTSGPVYGNLFTERINITSRPYKCSWWRIHPVNGERISSIHYRYMTFDQMKAWKLATMDNRIDMKSIVAVSGVPQ